MSQADLLKLLALSELNWMLSMWCSMKVTRVSCGILQFFAIITLPALVALFPMAFFVKLALSTALMYILIVKLTDAKYFPDGVLLVGVANVFYLIIGISLIARFA